MAFISVADELKNKTVTLVENKFIKKYLPELDAVAVKIYLYSVYISQNGSAYTPSDFAKTFDITEEKLLEYFEYLDEFELIKIISKTPLQITIADCDNYYGKPKKLHPEKYDGLYEELQAIITERIISQDEFREYLILLEEYGLERNALVMIVNYCVNLKGGDISGAYIKKVAKNFCAESITSAAKVEEKLSAYTVSTSSLLKIFSACSIKRRPEVEDGELYKKWIALGFDDEAIICAAKCFKTKKLEKLDEALCELYKNRKFDVKEIDDYRKARDSIYNVAIGTAKSLGVYASDITPYVENYVTVWFNYGFSATAIEKISRYCFLSGRNSFDLMDDFVKNLYREAYVDDESIDKLIAEFIENDNFIKNILSACGLTRKIINYDRQALARWREWNFSDEMIIKAAELSGGKNNPVASMNYLLSQWKNAGIYIPEAIPKASAVKRGERKSGGANSYKDSESSLDRALRFSRMYADEETNNATDKNGNT